MAKIGHEKYTVTIQPSDAMPRVGAYSEEVSAPSRWEAVKKVDSSFDTGRPAPKK